MSGSEAPRGRFCWYELMTSDPTAAPAFYGPVTGWGTQVWDEGEKPYTMWTNGEQPIGGVMELPEEAKAQGAPPHWIAHVSTPDVTATTARARELGGTVLLDLMAVPAVGTFSVIRDPQGAVISVYQPEAETPGHDDEPRVGEFSWSELATDDLDAAWSFYSQLFDWQKAEAMDMGEMGTYQMFGRGAHPIGAMYGRPPQIPVSCWLYYARVPDVHAAVKRVEEHGGQVLNGPMEVPGNAFIAQCMDPQGAMFALHSTGAA